MDREWPLAITTTITIRISTSRRSVAAISFVTTAKDTSKKWRKGGPAGPHGWLTGAAFLDIDNDGDLDLFIGNYITWTPEIDKVQGFQLTGIGRAYGPPTSFSGS